MVVLMQFISQVRFFLLRLQEIWNNVPNVTFVYRMDGEQTDRSVLTPKMAELCVGKKLIKVKPDQFQNELRNHVIFPLDTPLPGR